MQKVWFRASKQCWFATITQGGRQQQIHLVKAPHTRDGRKLAEKHLIDELASRDLAVEDGDGVKEPAWATVAHVLQAFLKHSQKEHDPETAAWHRHLLSRFEEMYGKLRYARLRKKHVRAWLQQTGYNPTSQNKALGALKRAFNWAVEEELITKNPIAHVRKPKIVTRDRTLTITERQLILASFKDAAFRDYVQALTLTGCRPGEIARVTAAEVELALGVWVLPRHKTAKRTGKPRVVYLCPEALELTKRLMAERPEGPLFLNVRGKPWKRNAIRNRFRRLRAKFIQLKGIVAYTYRGSFATDAMATGVPDATVAQLLGHQGTETLHKFYNRLASKVDHLKDAAGKAIHPAVDEPPPGSAR
jgi:integrase